MGYISIVENEDAALYAYSLAICPNTKSGTCQAKNKINKNQQLNWAGVNRTRFPTSGLEQRSAPWQSHSPGNRCRQRRRPHRGRQTEACSSGRPSCSCAWRRTGPTTNVGDVTPRLCACTGRSGSSR